MISGEDGYTLIELLVVFAVLGIVLAPLATSFTSAMRSQASQTRREESYQNARLALQRMRLDIHCAGGVKIFGSVLLTLALSARVGSPCTRGVLRLRVGRERGDDVRNLDSVELARQQLTGVALVRVKDDSVGGVLSTAAAPGPATRTTASAVANNMSTRRPPRALSPPIPSCTVTLLPRQSRDRTSLSARLFRPLTGSRGVTALGAGRWS